MPNCCYRGAKVLHFSGNKVGRRAESDALAAVAPLINSLTGKGEKAFKSEKVKRWLTPFKVVCRFLDF